METRANYIAVGLMTLVAIVAAFFFIYWAGNYEGGDDRRALNVRIVGSVSGLAVGSAVQFNGIDVGRVTALGLDQSDPRFVIPPDSSDGYWFATSGGKPTMASFRLTNSSISF